MFLSRLNDLQKQSFLVLADALVKADGVVLKEEDELLSIYIKEMDKKNGIIPENVNIRKEIPKLANNSSDEEKRIIFLELLALANVDGNFAEEEKEIIQQVICEFQISNDEYEKCIHLLDRYTTACSVLNNYIDGGI